MSKISQNAFARLLALRNTELGAVKMLKEGDGYSDFFVEGSGPPWHEAFGDSGRAVDPLNTASRVHALSSMTVLQAYMRARSSK
jgi:hypothetical protein